MKNIGAIKPFGDPTLIQRDYLPEEFKTESKEHDIVGSVHIQCDGAIPDPVKESLWIESLNQSHQLPTAHIGFVDLSSPKASEVLDRYSSLANCKGVRQILSRIQDKPEISFSNIEYLENEIWRKNYSLLEAHKFSFDLQLYPEQMTKAASFFAKHPNIPVVIDHAGSPYDQSIDGLIFWKQGLSQLAQLPHCHIKLSGFGMFDNDWNMVSIQPIIDIIFELFGPERVMFGSNYPVDKLMKSYDSLVKSILDCCLNTGLTELNIKEVFYKNSRDFYTLKL